ncbi:MAG: hypothetical protein MRZ79_17940 [Bacteroidia bacterium]|nr:hypothetical protein [Bacteroidia bacterium]
MKTLRLSLFGLLLALLVSCDTENLAVTPTADITFVVKYNASGEPVPNARVYLFQTRSTYDNYVMENPDADPSISPNLSPTNVGTTNSSGIVQFLNYDLDGTSFASGSSFTFDTDPIYYRVEGTENGSDYLTNDGNDNRFDFGEIESGGSATLNLDVFIK